MIGRVDPPGELAVVLAGLPAVVVHRLDRFPPGLGLSNGDKIIPRQFPAYSVAIGLDRPPLHKAILIDHPLQREPHFAVGQPVAAEQPVNVAGVGRLIQAHLGQK
jgi:hypothetical protein